MLKGYDDWLFSGAEDQYDDDHSDCLYGGEDCCCKKCTAACRADYLDAQGEYQYELNRERR